jgi:hypothetical protein
MKKRRLKPSGKRRRREGKSTEMKDYDAIAEMNHRQAEVGMLMQRIAVHALVELAAKIARGEPLDMSASEVKKMLDAAAKLIEDSTPKVKVQ